MFGPISFVLGARSGSGVWNLPSLCFRTATGSRSFGRAFELGPKAPRVREGDPAVRIAQKYGLTTDEAAARIRHVSELAPKEGLDLQLLRARSGNTFDAHRLLLLAAARGMQDAVKERFFRACLTEGEPIGEPEVLVRLATEAGLDVQ